MSETSVKGIVYDRIPLNVMNIAFLRKMEKFDCAISLDEQSTPRSARAQLAALNAILGKKSPSVLIITPSDVMYEWYENLLTGIGADFKFITPEPQEINYFSPKIGNLFICDKKAYNSSIFRIAKEQDFSWDLVMIDIDFARNNEDVDLLLENFDFKAKKLVLFAPFVQSKDNIAQKLASVPIKFLADSEKAAYFALNYPKENITDFTLSTPYSRYYTEDTLFSPKITVVEYSVSSDVLKAAKEQTPTKIYRSGGNVFEELALDTRKLYIANKYDVKTIQNLRKTDIKLDAYINLLSRLLKNSQNRIITYFTSEKTLNYVQKALKATELSDFAAVKKNRLHNLCCFADMEVTAAYLETGERQTVRSLLMVDSFEEQCGRMKNITHIINYELSNDPVVLQRRYLRSGIDGFGNPEFIVFGDEENRFDGRILRRVLPLNLCHAFVSGIPGRNVYLYMPELGKILSNVIKELENLENIGGIELCGLIDDYNTGINFSESPNVNEQEGKAVLIKLREQIKRAFEISDEHICKAALADIIEKKAEELRKGCCRLDGGILKSKTCQSKNSAEYQQMQAEIVADEKTISLNEARRVLNGCGNTAELKKALDTAEESDKEYVYYCAWRYLSDNGRFEGGYDKFLKELSEEAI